MGLSHELDLFSRTFRGNCPPWVMSTYAELSFTQFWTRPDPIFAYRWRDWKLPGFTEGDTCVGWSKHQHVLSLALLDEETNSLVEVSDGKVSASVDTDGWPRLSVRIIDGLSVVDIVNVEVLFDWDVVRNLDNDRILDRKEGEKYTRLLLDFSGVRYMSSDVLGTLAMLHRQITRAQGRWASAARPGSAEIGRITPGRFSIFTPTRARPRAPVRLLVMRHAWNDPLPPNVTEPDRKAGASDWGRGVQTGFCNQ